MQFTKEDIETFISARFKHVECPVCDHNDWAIYPKPGSEEFTYLPSAVGVQNRLPGSGVIAVLTMWCRNCGYIRQHNAGVILGAIIEADEKSRG